MAELELEPFSATSFSNVNINITAKPHPASKGCESPHSWRPPSFQQCPSPPNSPDFPKVPPSPTAQYNRRLTTHTSPKNPKTPSPPPPHRRTPHRLHHPENNLRLDQHALHRNHQTGAKAPRLYRAALLSPAQRRRKRATDLASY